jgi:cell division protein ZipA
VAELRWLLLLIGIGVIAAIYFYSRYQTVIDERIGRAKEARLKRKAEVASSAEAYAEPETVPVAEEVIESLQEPAPAIPGTPSKVVAIRLMSKENAGFPAEQLILSMRELGLRHGQFGIFHQFGSTDNGPAIFSVASLIEPGSFDLTQIKTRFYPGVSIFLALPGMIDGVQAFDEMLDTARKLAKRLDGELLDEQGSSLSIQRERYLREEIIQFQHQIIE